MIVINTLEELSKYKSLIDSIYKTNFQQTYENLYSIHYSNNTAITFIYNKSLTTFIKRDECIYECAINIEPIISNNLEKNFILEFLNKIKDYLNKTIYLPLVYEDSKFYYLMKDKIYNYKRLYTSLSNHKKIGQNILSYIASSNRVYFSNRNIKKFEKNMYVNYLTKTNVKEILTTIEYNSWKKEKKQDMTTKIEQLKYYSKLVELGIATLAIAYEKETNNLVAYRLDAIFNNKICVLKNSYIEDYQKYSPGSYLLLYDLFQKYPNIEYIDLYGGPGLAKEMIETDKINRYDFVLGNQAVIKELELKRIKWDKKNYTNYKKGNSIKEVFTQKTNVLAVTSIFGLGPVGKLSAIVDEGKEYFNWYAAGEEFDINIFNKNVFKDTCFTMEKEILKKFIDKYKIKYAVVVLKNKMARLLLELGVKVVYVDSLPFMWSQKDAETGKVPYKVDCYCAQDTIKLDKHSREIFSKVDNLCWIKPIVNQSIKEKITIKDKDFILINLGGLHSPSTKGDSYIDIVLKTLLKIYKDEHIIITTSTKSKKRLENTIKDYLNKKVKIKTLKQEEFYTYITKSKEFFTSPGLTTIVENAYLNHSVIFLPPQNLSQFYNIEYGKQVSSEYKEITWNNNDLTLKGLEQVLKEDEHGVIEEINKRIDNFNNEKFKKEFEKYILNILSDTYNKNKINKKDYQNGSKEVIDNLKRLISNNEKA